MNGKPRPVLQMRNIHASYGTTKALRGVDFDLYSGEIHALIGEHRAGKSTLVKILSGAERKEEGQIFLEGKEIEMFTPKSSLKHRIGIVYQHLTIIPHLNAIENIFTGQMLTRRIPVLRHHTMQKKTCNLLNYIDYSIDLKTPVFSLSAAQQYMVEFTRAIMFDPRIIILDEVANKLTPEEMKKIYRVLLDYRDRGASVIYISHDMDEVLSLADRVTVLKNGYRRGTEHCANLDKYRLFQLTYSFRLDQEKLEYSESRFLMLSKYLENIIHHLPVGSIVLDSTNRIHLLNFAATEFFQFDTKEVVNSRIETILEGRRFEHKEEILRAILNQKPKVWEEIEVSSDLILKVQVFPLHDEDKTFLGTVIFMEDISMNKYMTDYLIQSEKMASIAEVAVGVAHEINNPLYIIKNYLTLLKTTASDPDMSAKIVKIEKELGRIVEIVTNLLSFSRLKPSEGQSVDLYEILSDVLILLQHNFSEKSISLHTDLPEGKWNISGDENRLKQVFMNLLMNSIDAVLDSGTIDIKLRAADGSFVVQIRDNGYGIPDDIYDKIFNPFFTTKITKKNTGLGLSVCRHIIQEHDGTINFQSVPGEETVFTISFPAAGNH